MQKFTQYLRDTLAELRQVKWPTQNQAVVYTALLIGICLFVGAYLGLFDNLFAFIINTIVNRI